MLPSFATAKVNANTKVPDICHRNTKSRAKSHETFTVLRQMCIFVSKSSRNLFCAQLKWESEGKSHKTFFNFCFELFESLFRSFVFVYILNNLLFASWKNLFKHSRYKYKSANENQSGNSIRDSIHFLLSKNPNGEQNLVFHNWFFIHSVEFVQSFIKIKLSEPQLGIKWIISRTWLIINTSSKLKH